MRARYPEFSLLGHEPLDEAVVLISHFVVVFASIHTVLARTAAIG